ncbi:MAG: hypothetical protein EZS28_044138 [Streblomastix strix]|uniref:Uncharacterized protein n=1 Tax=Streblomastix strix TaxID=222440 RepID=A0A5J4TSJ4_9EUKA|nr:MAG: hypothetical protein EZS28_044138 [Streblomastix strix]
MDCRPLNTQLKSQQFTMNDLNNVFEIWKKNDWACLMDIKSAINHVEVTGELDKYLVFTHGRMHYTQVQKPFGILIAQRTFAKTIQITIYRVRSKCPLKKEIVWIVEVFPKYELVINECKSRMKPELQFVFQRGNLGWLALVFHCIIQTRRTASITNQQINEQNCESNRLDKRNDSNKKVFDKIVLVKEPAGEQLAKDDRQEIDQNINSDGCFNFRMGASVIKDNPRIKSIYGQWEADMENSNLRDILAIYRVVQVLKEYIIQQEYR